MFYKFEYTSDEQRTEILNNNKDKYLYEEQNITEGNFLIFSDEPRLEDQIKQLKEDNLILMDVLATMYEGMLAKGTVE